MCSSQLCYICNFYVFCGDKCFIYDRIERSFYCPYDERLTIYYLNIFIWNPLTTSTGGYYRNNHLVSFSILSLFITIAVPIPYDINKSPCSFQPTTLSGPGVVVIRTCLPVSILTTYISQSLSLSVVKARKYMW